MIIQNLEASVTIVHFPEAKTHFGQRRGDPDLQVHQELLVNIDHRWEFLL